MSGAGSRRYVGPQYLKRLSGRAGVIKQILAHLERKAESKEFVTIQFLDQITAPHRFVRVIDEISLTQSTHQITARKNSGS